MPLRGLPQGGVPIGMMNAIQGTVSVVSLITLAAGTSQNVVLFPSDFVIVTATNAGNSALTLPDPNKYGGVPGDQWVLAVGQVGGTAVSIFPPTGGTIDAASANAAVTAAAGTTATFILQSFTATTSVWIGDGGS